MNKFFLSLATTIFLIPCSSDTLEIQINNISKGGILHLAVYDSKEVFESDRGDQPGPQPGIVAGIVKEVSTGVFTEIIDVHLESMQLVFTLMLIKIKNWIQIF